MLTDLPPAGLRVAARRATAEGLTGRYGVTAAGGAHLPFRAEAFDAIVHADVLCWLSSARFVDVVEIAAYLDTARAWLRYGQQFAVELAALEPPGAFADILTRRRTAIAAIEAGLRRRSLFLGTRPPRRS